MILHPVRFRIIQRFIDGKKRTAKQLAKELKDITQATLYRQLDILVKNDMLKIVKEKLELIMREEIKNFLEIEQAGTPNMRNGYYQ